jgi:hypothetical protein
MMLNDVDVLILKDVFTFNILVFLTAILPQECVFSPEISDSLTVSIIFELGNKWVVIGCLYGLQTSNFTEFYHFIF